MRKKLVIAALFSFIISLLFTSCSSGGSHMVKRPFYSDKEAADKRFEQILGTIKNRDKSALKKLFSKKSIAADNDFEESINELFDFFQGELVSYNNWGGPGISEGNNDDGTGRNWKSIESTYDVKTSEQKYRFAIEEFTVDTADQDNVGICSLYIINAKDTDEQFAYWGDGKWTPGIIFNQKYEPVD